MRLRSAIKITSLVAIFSACLVAPTYLCAQSTADLDLILRGGASSSSKPCERQAENQTCYKFRMVFKNEDKEPVIIINPTLGYGTGLKEVVYQYDFWAWDLNRV